MAVTTPTTRPVSVASGHGVLLSRTVATARGVGATVVRSLLVFVPVFFVGTLITFALRSMSGLSPARMELGEQATPQAIARVEQHWGLDRPFPVQYWSWLKGVFHGDLGLAWSNSFPVSTLIRDGLTVSLTVATFALVIGIVVGMCLGTLAAARATTWADRLVTGVLSMVQVVPAFIFGIVLIEIFSVWLGILPSAGFVPFSVGAWPWLSHILLPAVALSFQPIANVARQLRSGLVAAQRENYVTGAIVRGLSPRRVFFRHVLRNGIGPAVAVLGLEFPSLVGSSVIVESIFALAGFGQFANKSAQAGDVPAVQGVLVVSIILVVTFNLIVNIILGRIAPAAQRGV